MWRCAGGRSGKLCCAPHAIQYRTVPVNSHRRACGLARWPQASLWPGLVAVLLITLMLTPPPTRAQSRAAVDSPAVNSLMARAIGDDAVGAFWTLPALEGLGLTREAAQLRPLLLHNYLNALEGRGSAAGLTLQQALRREGEHHLEGLRHDGVIVNADQRWNAVLREQLRIEPPPQAMPVPDEFAGGDQVWRELGPGLWHSSRRNGETRLLVLSLQVRNQHRLPLPLGDFTLQAQSFLHPLDCTPPRGAGAPGLLVLPGGAATPYLCVARRPPPLDDPSLKRALAQLRRDGRIDFAINSPLFNHSERQRLAADALAATVEARATAFLQENQSCARLGNCPPPRSAERASDRQRGHAAAPPFEPPDLSQKSIVARGLLSLFAVHCVIAWLRNNGLAAMVSGVITFAVTALHASNLVSAGSPSDGWGRLLTLAISAVAMAATVILPVLVGWTFHALYAVLGRMFSRR